MPTGVYKRTAIHRKILSRSMIGNKNALGMMPNKTSFKKGHKLSITTKKKMSKAKKGNNYGFQKGFTPWNKNKKIPFKPRPYQEGKPTWNKGKILPPLSLKHRLKISKASKGEKGNNWQGGITHINAKIRNSIKFKLWREAISKRDKWTCQMCGEIGGKLHPHHIWNFALFSYLRLNVDNGITLCIDCHIELHKKNYKQRGVLFQGLDI